MSENSNNDPIGKSLNLTPIQKSSEVLDVLKHKINSNSAEEDFDQARVNILDVIETGKESLNTLSVIASSSQHPRAFEVLAKMIDTIVEANMQLLELQSKIRSIENKEQSTGEKGKTVNNNLFVGSTSELQKVINDIMKDKNG